MKLSALLYLLPLFYALFSPDTPEHCTEVTAILEQAPTPTEHTRKIHRSKRSRNLSELCPSPKIATPEILALHRTRSAGASHVSPTLLPSPLSLGHAARSHFDFTST